MKRLLFLAMPALLVGIPASAEVESKIHKLCIEAEDYADCVRAMKGDSSKRAINSQGADIDEGNQCIKGYAYIDGDNCQDVSCTYPAGPLGHDQTISGLKDKNGKDIWSYKYELGYVEQEDFAYLAP